MKRNLMLGMLLIAAQFASGCVLSFRGVAEEKPGKPEEHAIFLFAIPIYYAQDTRPKGCSHGEGHECKMKEAKSDCCKAKGEGASHEATHESK